MSELCGGKESVWKDMYWLIRHLMRRNRDVCPRCGYVAFRHGFFPNDDTYCTECHLWEPDWEQWRKDIEEFQRGNIKNG
jgi:hypothetical protein